jgi:hypothetical protein
LLTEEQEALDKFKRVDQEIDNMLVVIIQDLDVLKEKAIKIDNASLSMTV